MPTPQRDLGPYINSLFQSISEDLLPGLGGGSFSGVPYDTAWVARIRSPHDHQRLEFPESFNWLLDSQNDDGSWGGPFPHTLLPTLAGLLALIEYPNQHSDILERSIRAQRYLDASLPEWSVDRHESVGFEVVAPALLKELASHGREFHFPEREHLLQLHQKKIVIAGPELLYGGKSNLVHSLEAFGGELDFRRITHLKSSNGGYGCSPAATATVLIHSTEWDVDAANWLTHLTNRAFDGNRGAMPNAYPIDVFEAAWALYNFAHVSLVHLLPTQPLARIKSWLASSLGPRGSSISRYSGIPEDSDDTGMVIAALNLSGLDTSAESLRRFERESHFACFELERGISMSANAHVLAALLSLPKSAQVEWTAAITKVLKSLFSMRKNGGHWQDKWHVSPYYATASAILAICQHQQSRDFALSNFELAPTVNWILSTQRADGGWGHSESTLEESVYAVQSLCAMRDIIDFSSRQDADRAIAQGYHFLEHGLARCFPISESRLPKLWLGKELYAPSRVVISSILAALCSAAQIST